MSRFSFIHFRTSAAVGTIAVLMAATVVAQNDKQRPRDRTDAERPAATERAPGAPAAGGAVSHDDSMLANCLIVENQNEVKLAEFAQQRAQDPEVKKFAQQMIDDHGKFLQKLQRFAGQTSARTGDAASTTTTREGSSRGEAREGQPRREAQPGREGQPPRESSLSQVEQATPRTPPATAQNPARPNQTGTQVRENQREETYTSVRSTGSGLDPISLKRELGEKCLQTARRELEQKSGAEFDKCYMTMQVGMHLHAVDTMEVFQKHVSGELRQLLGEGIQTAQGHLQHAKDLAKRLDHGSSADTTRREKTEK